MIRIEQRFSPESNSHYLDQIDQHLEHLRNLGISEPPIILSGSAVFLYDFGVRGQSRRIPTDLDVVLTSDDFSRINGQRDRLSLKLIESPRVTKWGMQYHNSILEGDGNFPVDMMPTLNTLYPEEHQFLPGELYTFPDFNQFPILTRTVRIKEREYTLASPGYILFYKITQMRNGLSDNGTIKQDLEDIRRILSLGIISPEELNQELYILTYGDGKLRRKILAAVNGIGAEARVSFPFLDIETPQLTVEEQIEGLRSLSEVFNQIFGKGKWCYSNGTALAIHSFSKGVERRITDIDVFITEGNVANLIPDSFFNIPFGRVAYDEDPVNVHGISYLEPQLRGRVFLFNGVPMKVDIISASRMRRGDGKEMIVDRSTVGDNLEIIDGLPVMGLELIRRIKEFSRREPPKTDKADLRLIDELLSS